MVVKVASSTGQSVRTVALASFALTLWTFLQIEEQERFARVEAEHARLDAAGLSAVAYHEPKKLEIREQRFLARVGAIPSREEALRRAAELNRRHDELMARSPLPEIG